MLHAHEFKVKHDKGKCQELYLSALKEVEQKALIAWVNFLLDPKDDGKQLLYDQASDSLRKLEEDYLRLFGAMDNGPVLSTSEAK